MFVEFADPRLVAAYDTLNAYEPDAQPGFYRALAAELRATAIVDLRFRSKAELTESLSGAGFAIAHVFGDWDRRPVSQSARELIVVARRVA